MGTPRMRRPWTSLYGAPDLSLEKLAMAWEIEVWMEGLERRSWGSILVPDVVVIMRVFSVFMKAPSGSATSLNVLRSRSTSSSGTRKFASST